MFSRDCLLPSLVICEPNSNKSKKYNYANGFKFMIIYLIPITISLKEIMLFATNRLTTQCNWLVHAIAKGCMCNYI
jgi:hypothetical protein